MVDCGSGNTGNRFVCPSDRQLALRAKLNTGWSMKTATLGINPNCSKSPPLGESENETIKSVIKRAEQLDINEKERIGKLVDKLETMRRNALGRSPSQCLLCGIAFGMLRAQKVSCLDCKRFACQKCAIEGPFNKSHCNSKEQWLCLICAETREIWKKSGAWFFNCMPKYILPSNNNRFSRSKSLRKSKKYKDEDSSSDEERFWARNYKRTSVTIENTQDTRDQESRYSFNDKSYVSSSESVLYREIDPLKSVSNLSTLNEQPTNIDDFDGDRTTESSGTSRRESTVSRSLSDWNWTDSRSDDKISPGSSSVNSSIFKGLSEQKPVDNPLGIIELSIFYDDEANTLNCTIHRAKNLIPMDISGLSDPFCKLNILPSPKVSTRLRTKTVHKTRNPEFNEKLTFYDISETSLKEKSLHIIVVDDDKYGHDYMGETRINLARLRKQKTLYITAPLENLRPEQKGPLPEVELNEWFDDIWSRGQILVSLCYSTKKRALLVTVVRCINLLPMDNNGLSDPFVKLHLKSDQYHKKYKTSVKWKNLNPEFNEEFAFETRPTELYTQSLHLAVFDKDYGKSNDYLGGLILGGNGSKGRRLKHWLDMIKYPDHRHEQWHNLTEDVLE